jgi:hypothetical protein
MTAPTPYPQGATRAWPDAGELLRGLLGREPGTISGRSNTVLAIDGDHVLVATEHSSITTSSSVLDGTGPNREQPAVPSLAGRLRPDERLLDLGAP